MLHKTSGGVGVGNTYIYSSKASNTYIVSNDYNSVWNTFGPVPSPGTNGIYVD